MNITSYTTSTSTFRSIRLPSFNYDRINFHRLEDDYLEEPDEDELPDDNIIYLNKEEQSTDD